METASILVLYSAVDVDPGAKNAPEGERWRIKKGKKTKERQRGRSEVLLFFSSVDVKGSKSVKSKARGGNVAASSAPRRRRGHGGAGSGIGGGESRSIANQGDSARWLSSLFYLYHLLCRPMMNVVLSSEENVQLLNVERETHTDLSCHLSFSE